MKQQLKEFEELQSKDPEQALKKLEELEKARALERHTLRHKNTGKWAKSKLVRAKYDKEVNVLVILIIVYCYIFNFKLVKYLPWIHIPKNRFKWALIVSILSELLSLLTTNSKLCSSAAFEVCFKN